MEVATGSIYLTMKPCKFCILYDRKCFFEKRAHITKNNTLDLRCDSPNKPVVVKFKSSKQKFSTIIEPGELASFQDSYHTLIKLRMTNLKKKVRKAKKNKESERVEML